MKKNYGANHNNEVKDIPSVFEIILSQTKQLNYRFNNKNACENVVHCFSDRLSFCAHFWPFQSQNDSVQ
jgi:hypothetical protein